MRKGGLRTEESVKDVNGRLLRGNEARKRWAEYFEELLNVQEDIVAVGGLFRQNTYLQNKKHMLTCQRWDWLL